MCSLCSRPIDLAHIRAVCKALRAAVEAASPAFSLPRASPLDVGRLLASRPLLTCLTLTPSHLQLRPNLAPLEPHLTSLTVRSNLRCAASQRAGQGAVLLLLGRVAPCLRRLRRLALADCLVGDGWEHLTCLRRLGELDVGGLLEADNRLLRVLPRLGRLQALVLPAPEGYSPRYNQCSAQGLVVCLGQLRSLAAPAVTPAASGSLSAASSYTDLLQLAAATAAAGPAAASIDAGASGGGGDSCSRGVGTVGDGLAAAAAVAAPSPSLRGLTRLEFRGLNYGCHGPEALRNSRPSPASDPAALEAIADCLPGLQRQRQGQLLQQSLPLEVLTRLGGLTSLVLGAHVQLEFPQQQQHCEGALAALAELAELRVLRLRRATAAAWCLPDPFGGRLLEEDECARSVSLFSLPSGTPPLAICSGGGGHPLRMLRETLCAEGGGGGAPGSGERALMLEVWGEEGWVAGANTDAGTPGGATAAAAARMCAAPSVASDYQDIDWELFVEAAHGWPSASGQDLQDGSAGDPGSGCRLSSAGPLKMPDKTPTSTATATAAATAAAVATPLSVSPMCALSWVLDEAGAAAASPAPARRASAASASGYAGAGVAVLAGGGGEQAGKGLSLRQMVRAALGATGHRSGSGGIITAGRWGEAGADCDAAVAVAAAVEAECGSSEQATGPALVRISEPGGPAAAAAAPPPPQAHAVTSPSSGRRGGARFGRLSLQLRRRSLHLPQHATPFAVAAGNALAAAAAGGFGGSGGVGGRVVVGGGGGAMAQASSSPRLSTALSAMAAAAAAASGGEEDADVDGLAAAVGGLAAALPCLEELDLGCWPQARQA
ncbi:hypothetical protein GPECTOR_32g411 [Gonium pectorale]|uniref:Uncharacterized protein n=1 Tax=Gonium pectorale TaxID=33097 RepID=A0A150GD89_GONPE|nr:hypothetical protein GPECTOR_32g411 [Gonium pectorale]|eukprot:KXZ47799.1 hypothetical protein GPECTOR_32g411 [Gonium pectorale]